MKNPVGKLTLVAAMSLTLAPLASLAQDPSSQTLTAGRNLDRLTLLTGPNLLSPARNAPQSGDSITIGASASKFGFEPSFRFVPGVATVFSRSGTLTLSRSTTGTLTFSTEGIRKDSGLAPRQGPPPNPDSLRFESKLHATPPATPPTITLQGRPGLKRH